VGRGGGRSKMGEKEQKGRVGREVEGRKLSGMEYREQKEGWIGW
jgi:hypothetical protein